MRTKPHNIIKGERIAITHGELCLIPVDAMPAGETERHTSYIAAHSETGHNHVIESKAGIQVLEAEERHVLIEDVARLFHQKTFDKHETRYIAPGAYKITHKTEYDPFQQIIRQVWD